MNDDKMGVEKYKKEMQQEIDGKIHLESF